MRVVDAPARLATYIQGDRALRAVVYGYLALLPIQVQINPLLRLAPSDVVLAVGLLIVANRLRLAPHLVGIWHGLLLMLFAASAISTLIFTGELSTWALMNKTLGLGALLAAYLAVGARATTFAKLVGTLHFLILSVAVYNFAAVLAFVSGLESSLLNSRLDLERLAGGLHDPNAYGGLLVMCLAAYGAFRATSARRFGRVVDIFVVASLSAGIILTLSRSAWMALGFSFLALVILQKNRRAALAGAVAVVVLGLGALSFSDTDIRALELSFRFDTIQDRLALNDAAIREATLNPLGMGLGGFQDKYGAIVHNTLLWFGADLGLIGVAVFIGFSVWMLRRLLEAYRRHSGPERAVVVGLGLGHIAMLSMSLSIEAFYQRHWWVVMALIAAATGPGALPLEPEGRV